MEDFIVGGYVPHTSIQVTFDHVMLVAAVLFTCGIVWSLARRVAKQQRLMVASHTPSDAATQ